MTMKFSEEKFKTALSAFWYMFTTTSALMDGLRGLGLEITKVNPGMVGFEGLEDMQDKGLISLMILVGIHDSEAKGRDGETKLGPDLLDFFNDVRTQYPDPCELGGFPAEFYDQLKVILRLGCGNLPWEDSDTVKTPVINAFVIEDKEHLEAALVEHAGGSTDEVEGVGLFDDLEPAFVGFTNNNRVVYSYDKIVELLMKRDGMTQEDAMEYIDFNIIRAIPYMSKPPLILYPIDGYREDANE